MTGADGKVTPLGFKKSEAMWNCLKTQGMIDARGKVQDSLKQALKGGTLILPAEFQAHKEQIEQILKKLAGRLEIKNADERRQVRLCKEVYLGEEFKALWDRIKHKTTYRLKFDNEELIQKCICAVQEAPAIPRTRLQWRKADLAIGKAGVEATEREGAATVVLDEHNIELPDILTDLQDRTQLTRRTICSILTGSGRLDDFKRNPQEFIDLAAKAINRSKREAIAEGIKYQRLGDEQYYAQELFEQEELTGYLKNLCDADKSVYEKVVYDSDIERNFVRGLETNPAVKVYAKLPGWFTVPTPLGSYNPDWAVLVEEEERERLYFVVETKGTSVIDDLRQSERDKIDCAKKHFDTLKTGARLKVVKTFEEFSDIYGAAYDGDRR